MSLFSDFSTRADWEKQGVQFTWDDNEGPLFECRVARSGGANSDKLDKVRDRVMAPLRNMVDPPMSMVNKATVRMCAEVITLPGSWKFKEREGLQCEGCTFRDGTWSILTGETWQPKQPEACLPDGWVRGVQPTRGVIVPDTADNIEKMFTALPELYRQLSGYASNVQNYREKELEADGKNS